MKIVKLATMVLLVGSVFGEEAKPAAEAAKSGTAKSAAEASKSEAAKPSATLTDLETHTFVLKYAKAEEVAEALNKLCEKLKLTEAAVAFPESHSVAVAGSKQVVEACAKIVADIDKKPKQVYVEARFFDLMAGDIGSVGVDWSMLGTSVMPGVNPLSVDGSLAAGLKDAKNLSSGNWKYTGTITASGLHLALAALRTNRDGRLFANPRVVVSSGKKATVDISTKRPNVIISAKRTTGNDRDDLDIDAQLKEIPGKDKQMFAGEAFFWWGIGLMVEPYVGEDGIITAKIIPNVSVLSDPSSQKEGYYVTAGNADDSIPASRFPIIDVKRIETEFSLKSGETAVIGGLAKTEHEDVDSGIPFLSKIWGLKWLFGQSTRLTRQREILVLVTMGLVDPENPDKKAGMPKNAFLSREFINGEKKEPGDLTKDELEEKLDRGRQFFRK